MVGKSMTVSQRLLVGASLALFACASTHTVHVPLTKESRAELAELLPGSADIAWREGGAVSREAAVDISIADGVASWVRADKAEQRRVPEAALRSMDWNSHSRGAGRGALIGGLSLGLFMATYQAATGRSSQCPGPGHEVFFCISGSRAEFAVLAGVLGFVAGAIIGALIGAVSGTDQHVEFVADPAR